MVWSRSNAFYEHVQIATLTVGSLVASREIVGNVNSKLCLLRKPSHLRLGKSVHVFMRSKPLAVGLYHGGMDVTVGCYIRLFCVA